MNKKIIASVLAVASVLTVSAGALADDNITVTVNGNNVSFVEITPFIENDHTLVPMREIFEALAQTYSGMTKQELLYHMIR